MDSFYLNYLQGIKQPCGESTPQKHGRPAESIPHVVSIPQPEAPISWNEWDIRPREIGALREHRFVAHLRERVDATVAEIQLGWVTAFAELAPGAHGRLGLSRIERYNLSAGVEQEQCSNGKDLPFNIRTDAGV